MMQYGYVARRNCDNETGLVYFFSNDEAASQFFARTLGPAVRDYSFFRVALWNPETMSGEFFELVDLSSDVIATADMVFLTDRVDNLLAFKHCLVHDMFRDIPNGVKVLFRDVIDKEIERLNSHGA